MQLSEQNLDQRVRGYDAIAGVGDWHLSNGVLCAAISGAAHETGLSPWGGELVDLGHCGRGNDQLSYTHLLPQMDQRRFLPVTAIVADVTSAEAVVTVERADDELKTLTRYVLDAASPHRLSIRTEVQRLSVGESLSLLGQLWLHPHRALTPFSVDTRGLIDAPGFDHPGFDREDRIEALQAMRYSDLTVLVGEEGEQPGISYAVRSEPSYLIDASGSKQPVEQFTLVEQDYTNQIWLARPLWFGGKGNPGRLEMLQSLFMDLEPGETLYLNQSIYVGDRADVASATNNFYQGRWIRGKVDVTPARIAVFDRQQRPLSEASVDPRGHFSIRLPQKVDRVVLSLSSPWAPTRRMEVSVDDEDLSLALAVSGAPGRLVLPRGRAMRLVVTGLGNTPDPSFGAYRPAYSSSATEVMGSLQGNSISLAGVAADPPSVDLAPGNYRIFASRGFEFNAVSRDIDIVAGQTSVIELGPLRRTVDVSGWISADFHVHTGFSFDSTVEPLVQLQSFVAQGADLLVATEHDAVADLGRIAVEQGLDDSVTVVSGVEVTGMAQTEAVPRTLGHVNLYPWPRDEQAFAGGVPRHEGMRVRQLMARVRERSTPPLVQLNHPRDLSEQSPDVAFFEHLSIGERYDQRLPLHNVQNRSLIEADPGSGLRDLDFDTYELANGAQRELYQAARADWLALILQGEYRPALANSDSHDLLSPVAMPRSYVAYGGAIRHPLDTEEVWEAVRSGRVFGSSGPIPMVELIGEGGQSGTIGDTLSGRKFTLRASASATHWVNVDQLWVYVNGVVIAGGSYKPGELREIPIEVEQDSFIFVEFYGSPGEMYSVLAPGHTPMAFTNPLWIDADGDGRWRAPGLLPLPMAVSDPHSIPGTNPNEDSSGR